MSYNKVILEGNLSRDIETVNDGKIGKTAIAVNNKYTKADGEKVETVMFIDLTFFGKQVEIATEYLKKGSRVLVDGALFLETWEDKDTGSNRSKHSVTVSTFQMLDAKKAE